VHLILSHKRSSYLFFFIKQIVFCVV